MRIIALFCLVMLAPSVAFGQNPEQEIRAKTRKFTEAIVSKNLAILDDVFEKDPTNIYYDINEGLLVGFERLKRVWTAATTNFTISKFDFTDDVKIWVNGDNAVQAGTGCRLKRIDRVRAETSKAALLFYGVNAMEFGESGTITHRLPRPGARGPRNSARFGKTLLISRSSPTGCVSQRPVGLPAL